MIQSHQCILSVDSVVDGLLHDYTHFSEYEYPNLKIYFDAIDEFLIDASNTQKKKNKQEK